MAKGRRYGGKPKGYKHQKTLEKEAARELTRVIVTRALKPMLRSQIAHAIGIGHLYTRDQVGKYTKIENQARVDELLSTGEEGKDFFIFTKDPSVQAFTDLLNRALDKPKEQEIEITVETLDQRRERLAEGRKRWALVVAHSIKKLPE